MMLTFIGTKVINAKPMNKLDYNILRGWKLPSDENPNEEGYLVEYTDGGKPCHPDFKGYISWSPKDVFEGSYKVVYGIIFGEAVELLKLGHKVCRSGWNGKKMYLSYKPGYPNGIPANESHAKAHNCMVGDIVVYDAYIEMRTATGSFIPWLASQSDILANDWQIVKD